MKLSDLKKIVDRAVAYQEKYGDDMEVVIPVKVVGQVGPHAVVTAKTAGQGIDWDKGKFIIWPEKDLREIGLDELKKIRAEYDAAGWLWYEGKMKRKPAEKK